MPDQIDKLYEFLASDNIAEDLPEDTLEEIGQRVKERFDQDLQSRSGWEKRNEEAMKLAMQIEENKSFPWPEAANIKYPLLTTASMQFAARAYPALVSGTDIVKGRVVGFDATGAKRDAAIRVSKHMSYQVLEQMPDWEEDMDRMLMMLPILGCGFKKTYNDTNRGQNISEMVLPKDLVIDYYAKSLEGAHRKTHILRMNKNQILERQRDDIYLEVDLGDPVVKQDESVLQQLEPTSEALDPSVEYEILEQHTFWDLDDDGYEEPYIITVERESAKVLRIVARYDQDGLKFNEEGELVKITPDEYFTNYPFIPNPDGGFYDLGFGHLLGPINKVINSTINQLLDAGTLSNLQSGFLGKGFKRAMKGNMRFTPGEWKQLDVHTDDLKRAIYPLPVREPSNVLFLLLGSMIDAGQRLSSTMDSMIGENPGQNQKATTTLAVLEQGLKVFNSIHKRLHRALKRELQKLFVLNSKYMDPQEYFTILDPNGVPQGAQVFQTDYNPNAVDIIPASDPAVSTTEQKLAKATGLLELLPLGTVNPQVVTQRVLEAQEQSGIEQLMQMPPPQPNPEIMLEMQKLKQDYDIAMQDLQIKAFKARGDLDNKQKEIAIKELEAITDNISKERDRSVKMREIEEKSKEKSRSGE